MSCYGLQGYLEYWINVYPDMLECNNGNHVMLAYENKFNAERTATKHRLYRIHVKLK